MKEWIILLLLLSAAPASAAQESVANEVESISRLQIQSGSSDLAWKSLKKVSSRSKFRIELGGRLHASDAIPKPAPLPARRFGKGDLELGLGYTFVRFRSSLFRVNTSGLRSSFAYSVSDWMAIECSGTSAFGSQSSGSTLAKYVFYGAGIRIETPDPKISAWVHAVFGGIHMFPQTANSNSGIASEFGIGTDIRLKPLLYIRVQANYLRSRIYSQGQNNFNVGIGLVYRF